MYEGALKKNKFAGRSSDIHLGNMRDSKVQNFHKNSGRAVEAGAVSLEKDYASSRKATTEVPPRSSFEFYVWSDEGINLHVDFNSSPLDWTNRFRNEVRISESENGKKSRSLWQELSGLVENSSQGKSSFLWNSNSGRIDDQAKSSSSLKLTKDGIKELGKQNKGDCPLISNSSTPCSKTIKVADNLQENQSAVSSELTVNVVDNLMQDQSLCDSVGNSLSDPATLELQNSKPENESSEDCALPNGSCIMNPGVGCARASLSCSVERQNSEVASCHKYASVSLCDKDGCLDLSDPKNTSTMEQGGLVNSSEINFLTNGNNFPSRTEEWEVGKTVDGRESTEYSQFDDPLKKSRLNSDDQDSKMELHKKRKNRDSKIQGSSGTPATRTLRSMKNHVVMVLPRRSMRLISK